MGSSCILFHFFAQKFPVRFINYYGTNKIIMQNNCFVFALIKLQLLEWNVKWVSFPKSPFPSIVSHSPKPSPATSTYIHTYTFLWFVRKMNSSFLHFRLEFRIIFFLSIFHSFIRPLIRSVDVCCCFARFSLNRFVCGYYPFAYFLCTHCYSIQ